MFIVSRAFHPNTAKGLSGRVRPWEGPEASFRSEGRTQERRAFPGYLANQPMGERPRFGKSE